jgi:hypothetical protein
MGNRHGIFVDSKFRNRYGVLVDWGFGNRYRVPSLAKNISMFMVIKI